MCLYISAFYFAAAAAPALDAFAVADFPVAAAFIAADTATDATNPASAAADATDVDNAIADTDAAAVAAVADISATPYIPD